MRRPHLTCRHVASRPRPTYRPDPPPRQHPVSHRLLATRPCRRIRRSLLPRPCFRRRRGRCRMRRAPSRPAAELASLPLPPPPPPRATVARPPGGWSC